MSEIDTSARVRRDRSLRVIFPILTLVLGGVLIFLAGSIPEQPGGF